MDTPQSQLPQALKLLQAGRTNEARALYEDALLADPTCFDALFFLGLLASQAADNQKAADLLLRATQIKPQVAAAHSNLGLALQQLGNVDGAISSYEQAIACDSGFVDAHYNLGVIHLTFKNYESALKNFDRCIALLPNDFQAWSNRGKALQELKQPEQALTCFQQALSLKPDFVEAASNCAATLRTLNRLDEALKSCQLALAIDYNSYDALLNQGIILRDLHRPSDSLSSLDQALKQRPNSAEAHYCRSTALHDLREWQAAIAACDCAMTLEPNHLEALFIKGVALRALKKREEAIQCFNRLLSLAPASAKAYCGIAAVLQDQWDFEDSLKYIEAALATDPKTAEAHCLLGNVLRHRKQADQSLECFERAFEINPAYADAICSKGAALQDLRRLDEAMTACCKALEIDPLLATAHVNKGAIYSARKLHAQARQCFEKAIDCDPYYAEAYEHLGHSLGALHKQTEAIKSYQTAFSLGSPNKKLLGTLHFAKMMLCDWSDVTASREQIARNLGEGILSAEPFVIQSLIDDASLHLRAATLFAEEDATLIKDFKAHETPQKQAKRIRIGYFSADFRLHAVSLLICELIDKHDRDRFEVIAFSFGINTQDDMRLRLEKSFDQFLDVAEMSDLQIAELARSMQIDIAIDLGGYTGDCRCWIFKNRPAPIQISYLGYLGTSGTGHMDYLLADETLIDESTRSFYSEKVIYLPSYQVNDSQRTISDRRFTREELGLPSSGFVYCCFNNNYKITPDTFQSWMRILSRVPGSVLFLYSALPEVIGNLQREASAHGVAPDRLIFGTQLPFAEYLARYQAADLFLDTHPYNAGTTGSDALWAGLPVLTVQGESFPARMAASLLQALDLPDLVTYSRSAYEDLAVEIAQNPLKLSDIRRRLQANRSRTRLFDTLLFTRTLEAVYAHAHEMAQAGLSAKDFHVQNSLDSATVVIR